MRTFFGIDATGCDLSTSFCEKALANNHHGVVGTYPARIGVKKPPPHVVFPHLLHPPTAIQKNRKHPLPQFYYSNSFFRLGRLRGVVGHGVLLGNRRDDERRMEVHQRLP